MPPRLLLTLLWTALCAAAIQLLVGWPQLLRAWSSAAPAVLLLAAGAQLASYALRALRVYQAEPAIPRGRFGDCLRVVLLHNTANLLLPARSGEASFPLLLHRWFGVDPARGTGTLLWLRMLDACTLAMLLPLCLPGLLQHAASWLLGAAAMLALVLVLPAARAPLLRRLALRDTRWRRRAGQALSALPATRDALLRDLLLSLALWSIKLAGLGLALSDFAEVSWPRGIIAAAGGELTTVLPVHAPAGFGTFEAGVMLGLAGSVSPSVALAGAVNLHLLMLSLALAAGAAAAGGRRSRTAHDL